jgi:hypothetical protein
MIRQYLPAAYPYYVPPLMYHPPAYPYHVSQPHHLFKSHGFQSQSSHQSRLPNIVPYKYVAWPQERHPASKTGAPRTCNVASKHTGTPDPKNTRIPKPTSTVAPQQTSIKKRLTYILSEKCHPTGKMCESKPEAIMLMESTYDGYFQDRKCMLANGTDRLKDATKCYKYTYRFAEETKCPWRAQLRCLEDDSLCLFKIDSRTTITPSNLYQLSPTINTVYTQL